MTVEDFRRMDPRPEVALGTEGLREFRERESIAQIRSFPGKTISPANYFPGNYLVRTPLSSLRSAAPAAFASRRRSCRTHSV